MKSFFMVTFISIVLFFSFSKAVAGDKNDCIYGSNIDQVISFYQARLYLSDSEYKILSDIGKDAAKKVSHLKETRSHLIDEMNAKNLDLQSRKIRAYVINSTRNPDVGLGYTKQR